MRKYLLLVFTISTIWANAQTIGSWGDLYSYNRVTDIVRLPNEIYLCAAGRAMFTYDYANQEVAKFSKANGLNDVNVASLERDEESGLIVVGYENSNIDIIDGDQIINVSDIFDSEQFSGRRFINNIYIRNGIAYISTGFGVVELQIETQLIFDTWVIGDNNTPLEIYDIVFDDSRDSVWAATEDGIYKASTNDDLFFFESWSKDERFQAESNGHIDVINGIVFASAEHGNQDTLMMLESGLGWIPSPEQSVGSIEYLEVENNRLFVCFTYTAEERSDNGQIIQLVSPGYGGNSGALPLCAFKLEDERWFIGDVNRGLIFINNPSYIQRAKPLSPPSNRVHSLYSSRNGLVITAGDLNGVWAPSFIFDGFFRLQNESWDVFSVGKTDTAHDIIQVLDDPLDENRFFAAGMGTGILEFRNDELYQLWDEAATGGVLQHVGQNVNDIRTGGMAFDEEGVLWVTASGSATSLASLDREGNWEAHSIGTFNGRDMKNIRVLENGDFWIQARNDGIYAVRPGNGPFQVQRLGAGEGNGDLANTYVFDFEEDLDGEVWIATGEGVMVHYSPDNLFATGRNYDAQSILILENGVYQRLLGSEEVTAVEVDGANNKWFGTSTGGVFYTSEDGLDEIYHFTKGNSPLPSNRIIDVSVNDEDGTVYIATDLGVVTFNGTATAGVESMEDITVYPNPVRPGYMGPIAIRGLVQDAQVKITDVAGNLVFETRANGGQAIWMGNDLNGNRAATGVYMAYITDDLGENTEVVKILLVNGN
ncbi:MAG: hypothetical protein HWD92_01015 [Flavobacteriia bacterium]|nr:hypothetical protein [Flavobacteriia bacterium]